MFKYISLSNKTANIYTIHPTQNTSKRFMFLHFVYMQLKDWCNYSISRIRLPYLLKVKSEDSTRTWGENKTKQNSQANKPPHQTNQPKANTEHKSFWPKKKNKSLDLVYSKQKLTWQLSVQVETWTWTRRNLWTHNSDFLLRKSNSFSLEIPLSSR